MPGIAPRDPSVDVQTMGLVHLTFCPGDDAAVDTLAGRLRADGYRVVGKARRTGGWLLREHGARPGRQPAGDRGAAEAVMQTIDP